jgi:hypothetical protein
MDLHFVTLHSGRRELLPVSTQGHIGVASPRR